MHSKSTIFAFLFLVAMFFAPQVVWGAETCCLCENDQQVTQGIIMSDTDSDCEDTCGSSNVIGQTTVDNQEQCTLSVGGCCICIISLNPYDYKYSIEQDEGACTTECKKEDLVSQKWEESISDSNQCKVKAESYETTITPTPTPAGTGCCICQDKQNKWTSFLSSSGDQCSTDCISKGATEIDFDPKVKDVAACTESMTTTQQDVNVEDNLASTGGFLKDVKCAGSNPILCDWCDFLQVGNNIARWILGITGSIAVVMFMYGAFLLVASQGSEEMIKQGRGVLVNTAIAIIIILGAWQIVNIALGVATGTFTTDSGGISQIFGNNWYTSFCGGGK